METVAHRDGRQSAEPFVADTRSIARLRKAAAVSRGCDLYRDATQTVFGEGAAHARYFFVGEQPGDVEDREGHPFVGPAGRLLREALHAAEIDERDVYLTNAVKHFKYVWRGKRRIHAKPKRVEVQACAPWLHAELRAVGPALVVALGATAARQIFGPRFRLSDRRGRLVPSAFAPRACATIHPSAILRAPDAAARHAGMLGFVSDLRAVARLVQP
jgi:uracil-DNA glycosylase family protein